MGLKVVEGVGNVTHLEMRDVVGKFSGLELEFTVPHRGQIVAGKRAIGSNRFR